jgi:allantoin racemase
MMSASRRSISAENCEVKSERNAHFNLNTTASMTQQIGAAAQAAAAPGTTIEAVNPAFGPPSIEGYYDEVFSIPGLLAQMRAAPEADAYVIACFDDTGLDAARCSPPRR